MVRPIHDTACWLEHLPCAHEKIKSLMNDLLSERKYTCELLFQANKDLATMARLGSLVTRTAKMKCLVYDEGTCKEHSFSDSDEWCLTCQCRCEVDRNTQKGSK